VVTASWNGKVVAETKNYEEIESNVYFPKESVHMDSLRESSTITKCPWKGIAHYYDVVVDGKVNKDAAWYYPDPKPAAAQIKGHIAFWKGVEITGD
jgi:uncharacterized protein (DUF427 family)